MGWAGARRRAGGARELAARAARAGFKPGARRDANDECAWTARVVAVCMGRAWGSTVSLVFEWSVRIVEARIGAFFPADHFFRALFLHTNCPYENRLKINSPAGAPSTSASAGRGPPSTGIVTLPPRVSATAARTDPPCHRRIVVVSGGCPLQQ